MKDKRQGFSLIEHTADIGIRVKSPTLKGLFKTSAIALIKCAVKVRKMEYKINEEITLSATSLDELFKMWLSRLLFLFSSEGKIFTKIKINNMSDTKLSAVLTGDLFDQTRHRLNTDLKAITHHKLSVKKTRQGFEATFIIDV